MKVRPQGVSLKRGDPCSVGTREARVPALEERGREPAASTRDKCIPHEGMGGTQKFFSTY